MMLRYVKSPQDVNFETEPGYRHMNLNEHAAKIEQAALGVRVFYLLRIVMLLTYDTDDRRG
jgi:hypothetical protein